MLNVFDIAPSSIRTRSAFEQAVKADQRVSYFLVPPRTPATTSRSRSRGSVAGPADGGLLRGRGARPRRRPARLDDEGRDSIDRFDETGVLPTVLTWSSMRLACPIAAGVAPRGAPGERTAITFAPHGDAMLRLQLRYELAEQGDDA